jgi:hypothetical protein
MEVCEIFFFFFLIILLLIVINYAWLGWGGAVGGVLNWLIFILISFRIADWRLMVDGGGGGVLMKIGGFFPLRV